ncbi:MAG: CoA-binding protein [Nitrospira sp.]|nr:CoA-binding protein [Nitrospira sp.]
MTDASVGNSTVSGSETIRRILDECRRIAVVGLSSNPTRPSYRVAACMQGQGYQVIPVNPLELPVLGQPAYPSLAAVPGPIDLVSIFRKSDEAGAVVDAAITVGAKAVWLQEGVVDAAAAQRAQHAGLLVVMDRCWMKEHRKRAGLKRER